MGLFGGNDGGSGASNYDAIQLLRGVETPDIDAMQIQLEQLVQQGVITPEQAQVYQQQASQANNITLDPALQQAQMDALASLQDIGTNGMTQMDRAKLAQIQREEATQGRGAREAIIANAQASGMGGSGLNLMSQLKNQQDQATRQSIRDTDVAGMAQERALQALQGAGQLGGNMQQQSFNQQFQKAGAQDAINQFNTQNMQNTGNLNTAARNQAQVANLGEKQRVSDANTATRNTQQQYNKSLIQQDFENKYRKAGGQASALQNQANSQAQRQATEDAANKQMIGTLITTAAMASDENLKENISDFDASAFLDSLSPSKYNYKDPKFGKGKQVGVMAQDIEKEVPQIVVDTPEGKIVDYNKAGGPIFASLADIHNRLKKMEDK